MPHTETPGTEAVPATRMRWWTELPLILLVYACYSADGSSSAATSPTRSTTAWRCCAWKRRCTSTPNTR